MIYERPPCEPVNQPGNDNEGTDIRYDIQTFSALVVIFHLEQYS